MSKSFDEPGAAPMSVVIATLGGGSLKDTIEALNRGSVVPDELIVCIPEHEVHKISDLSFKNVKVLVTKCRGQVAQRAVGFQSASHNVVMQLDDDVCVDRDCVGHLLRTLTTHGMRVAVGPSLVSLATGESIHRKSNHNKLLKTLYYWIVNGAAGYQPGTIYKAGLNVGVDPTGTGREIFEVEWLAGGCVMHYKQNLVLENFYPYQGKAYCEDLIHSYYLTQKGVKLLVDSRAICKMEYLPFENEGLREFIKNLAADFKIRRYFMQLSSRKSLRMYFIYFANCFIYTRKNLRRLPFFRTRGGS